MHEFDFDCYLNEQESSQLAKQIHELSDELFGAPSQASLLDKIEKLSQNGNYAKLVRVVICQESVVEGQVIEAVVFTPDSELSGGYELVDDEDFDEPESARLYRGKSTEITSNSSTNNLEVTHYLAQLTVNSIGDLDIVNIEDLDFDNPDPVVVGAMPSLTDHMTINDMRAILSRP